jgi:hypothetical protein
VKKSGVFKNILLLTISILGFQHIAFAQQTTSADHYLFSYFVGNGEDGLLLAHSTGSL